MFPFLYMPYNFLLRFGHLKKNTSHSLCILALFRRRPSLISLAGGSRTSQTISDLFHPLASDCGTAALTVHLCFEQLPDSWHQACQLLSQARQKPITRAAPRQARTWESWSSLLFLSQGRIPGMEDFLLVSPCYTV